MINVSKPYLPPLEEFGQYLEAIWKRAWVSNGGPCEKELERKLETYTGANHVCMVSSGTMALQLALKSLSVQGEIITTAFSHVSTLNAIIWNNSKPVFVDIEDKHFCIDPVLIEKAITKRSRAILATHVYGYPCQVEQIREIATRHGLKVIYDGAHAFGVKMDGRSLLNQGDATAASFHATKVFHTIEGGAVVTNNPTTAKTCEQLRNFGLPESEPALAGINGKNSELHAAVGLCNLKRMEEFISKRRELTLLYHRLLDGLPLYLPQAPARSTPNFAYLPILFDSPAAMYAVRKALAEHGVETRRYFYPSINQLPYTTGPPCPVAESVSQRILCLPLYHDLMQEQVSYIASIVRQHLASV